jgi:hypothetical protein
MEGVGPKAPWFGALFPGRRGRPRNVLIVLMAIELMLNGVNLAFVAFARQHGQVDGQVFAFVTAAPPPKPRSGSRWVPSGTVMSTWRPNLPATVDAGVIPLFRCSAPSRFRCCIVMPAARARPGWIASARLPVVVGVRAVPERMGHPDMPIRQTLYIRSAGELHARRLLRVHRRRDDQRHGRRLHPRTDRYMDA